MQRAGRRLREKAEARSRGQAAESRALSPFGGELALSRHCARSQAKCQGLGVGAFGVLPGRGV